MKQDQKVAIEKLFENRNEALGLFQTVRAYIEKLEGVRIEVQKTQVSFGTGRKFAWVWLPQMWIKKQPEASIVLTLSLDHEIRDKRIKESLEPSPGKWTHHIDIRKASNFDSHVRDWIHEAWEKSRKVLPS